MLKYTELIQQIECLMDDPTAAPMEKIAELATAYADACDWVNENVLFCVNTLRQGNASEALRLSRELDLLENYKTLVFDDYEAWLSAALTFGDVAIPAFNRRLIDELDAAQVCMKPIEEVLKSHRILAMSHSPLSARIPVLRKLVEMDPRNTGWKNELRDYESARLELIYDELSKKLSFNECLGLLKEIEGAKWSVEIPIKIKKKIAAIKQEYQKKNRQKQIDQLNAKLNGIADNLQQAYNSYDFEGAKRQRSSWFKVIDEFHHSQIIPPYDLIHSVDEVLQWIDSEQKGRDLLQEYNSKVAAVDKEMRRSISIDKCQRLILELSRAADAIGQEVPERFQNHLDKLIANEERKESRRGRFATGIFTVILLFVIGGVSFGVYEFIQWYRFNSLLENLSKYQLAVSKDRDILSEAYQFVQNLESSGYQLAEYPEVQKNIAYIKKLYEEDKIRHEDWKLLHDKIERGIKKGEPSSLEEIKELEKLSLLKEEKEAYAVLEKSNRDLLNDNADAFVKRQNEKLYEIQQAADVLLKSEDGVNVVKLREVETQVMQIRQLFADYAFGKPSLEKSAKDFESKCSELLASIKIVIDKSNSDSLLSNDLDSLASKMTSASEYTKALKSIIDQKDNSSYTADFNAVIEAQEDWGTGFVWNEFINQNKSIFSGSRSRTVILLKDFIANWNKVSFKPKELTTVKKINGRIPYYQSIIDCNPDMSLKPLKELCFIYSKFDFSYCESKGKRYYFNCELEEKRFYNYMETVSDVSDKRIKIEPSIPIVPLGNRSFNKKVNSFRGMIVDNTKYTECGIKILDFIYNDKSLQDPIIKYQFLTTALDCFTQTDKIIQEHFGAFVQQIDNPTLKDCNPFNTDDSFENRLDAERMLNRLKGFNKCVEDAQNRNEQLSRSFDVEILQPVGWLDKDGSQWKVRGIPTYADGELYIVKKSGLISIGTAKKKEVELKSVPNGKRGLPVFMIKTIKP